VCPFCVIPYEVFHQLAIEFGDVIDKIDMPVNKLLLNCSVKPFQTAISLRMLGVVVEVGQSAVLATLFEILLKFAAIVRLDSNNRERGYKVNFLRKSLPLAAEFEGYA